MTIEFYGFFAWIISTLCLIALVVGLLYLISLFLEKWGQVVERKGTASAKRDYVCEDVCGKQRAQELAKAMTDPAVSFEDFLQIYTDIKNTGA